MSTLAVPTWAGFELLNSGGLGFRVRLRVRAWGEGPKIKAPSPINPKPLNPYDVGVLIITIGFGGSFLIILIVQYPLNTLF